MFENDIIWLPVALSWLSLAGCHAQDREKLRNVDPLHVFVVSSEEDIPQLRATIAEIENDWRLAMPDFDFARIEIWANRMIDGDNRTREVETVRKIIQRFDILLDSDLKHHPPISRMRIRTKQDFDRYTQSNSSQLFSEIQNILRAKVLVSITDSDAKSAYSHLLKAFEINESQRLALGLVERVSYNRNMLRNVFLASKCSSIESIPEEIKRKVRQACLFAMWDVHCLESQLNSEVDSILLESGLAEFNHAVATARKEIRALNQLFVQRFVSLPNDSPIEEFERRFAALVAKTREDSNRKEDNALQLLLLDYTVLLRSEWNFRAHLAAAVLAMELQHSTPSEAISIFEDTLQKLFVPKDWVILDFGDGAHLRCEHHADSEALSWSIEFKKDP